MDENQVSDTGVNADNNNVAGEQDKMFTRDQLAKIVNAETAKAAHHARQEAEAKYQRDLEAAKAIQGKQDQRNAEVPRDVDANAIYQQVQEKFNQQMQAEKERQEQERVRAHMASVADNYLAKVEQGKTAYEDFDEVTKDFDPTAFPQLTFLLAGIDNAADVLYDLSKNPIKLAGLDRLAEKNPRQAHSELIKLSQSITVNKDAKAEAQNQNVAEPLDRLQPSRVSGSNGKMGIRDLRNQPWLRG